MIILTNTGRYDVAIIGEGSRILSFDGNSFKYFPTSATLEYYDEIDDPWNTHYSLPLSEGLYRLYRVQDELNFHETLHLELEEEGGFLTCYLLPNGFPNSRQKRVRQIDTLQQIGNNDSVVVRQLHLIERGNL